MNGLLAVARAFQSTPSGGKATRVDVREVIRMLFQSTPSGGKATSALGGFYGWSNVSIHAFRGEGDSAF